METYRHIQEIYSDQDTIHRLTDDISYKALEELSTNPSVAFDRALFGFLRDIGLGYLEEGANKIPSIPDFYSTISPTKSGRTRDEFLNNLVITAYKDDFNKELFQDCLVTLSLFILHGVINTNIDSRTEANNLIKSGYNHYMLERSNLRGQLDTMFSQSHVLTLGLVDHLKHERSNTSVPADEKQYLKKQLEEILSAAVRSRIRLDISDVSDNTKILQTNIKRQLYGFNR